jgi:hypothetical protein
MAPKSMELPPRDEGSILSGILGIRAVAEKREGEAQASTQVRLDQISEHCAVCALHRGNLHALTRAHGTVKSYLRSPLASIQVNPSANGSKHS